MCCQKAPIPTCCRVADDRCNSTLVSPDYRGPTLPNKLPTKYAPAGRLSAGHSTDRSQASDKCHRVSQCMALSSERCRSPNRGGPKNGLPTPAISMCRQSPCSLLLGVHLTVSRRTGAQRLARNRTRSGFSEPLHDESRFIRDDARSIVDSRLRFVCITSFWGPPVSL